MGDTCLGGCKEFSDYYNLEFSCCNSCHHEFDELDVEPLEHKVESGYFYVCCAALIALEEKTNPQSATSRF